LKISEVLNFDFFSIFAPAGSKRNVEEPMGTYGTTKQKVLVTLELDGDPVSLEQHIKKITAINKLLLEIGSFQFNSLTELMLNEIFFLPEKPLARAVGLTE